MEETQPNLPSLDASSPDSWRQHVSTGDATSDVLLRKEFVTEIEAGADDRTIKFIISTGSADREKDIINPTGWDTANYLKNPVVLFAHDYNSLPVARTTSLRQEGDTLIAEAEFADESLNPAAEQVYQMLRQGYLRGASVGFRPLTFQYNEDRGGVDFEKQELLEFSVVPVPANPGALMSAGLAGSGDQMIREWATKILSSSLDAKLPNSSVDGDNESSEAKGVTPPNPSGFGEAPLSEKWVKPTLGDFTDEDWSAITDAEKRSIATHFAWSSSRVPESYGELKLPHHKATGDVVWRGVASSAAYLDSTELPSGDVAAVRRHLANHYQQFDREAPWERDGAGWAAYCKARTKAERKTGEPLSIERVAHLLDDFGFEDEAVILITESPEATPGGAVAAPSPSLSAVSDGLAPVLIALDNLNSKLEALASAPADPVPLETFLEIEDDDRTEDIDFSDVREALRQGLDSSLSDMVGSEVRSAFNALRGRID